MPRRCPWPRSGEPVDSLPVSARGGRASVGPTARRVDVAHGVGRPGASKGSTMDGRSCPSAGGLLRSLRGAHVRGGRRALPFRARMAAAVRPADRRSRSCRCACARPVAHEVSGDPTSGRGSGDERPVVRGVPRPRCSGRSDAAMGAAHPRHGASMIDRRRRLLGRLRTPDRDPHRERVHGGRYPGAHAIAGRGGRHSDPGHRRGGADVRHVSVRARPTRSRRPDPASWRFMS